MHAGVHSQGSQRVAKEGGVGVPKYLFHLFTFRTLFISGEQLFSLHVARLCANWEEG